MELNRAQSRPFPPSATVNRTLSTWRASILGFGEDANNSRTVLWRPAVQERGRLEEIMTRTRLAGLNCITGQPAVQIRSLGRRVEQQGKRLYFIVIFVASMTGCCHPVNACLHFITKPKSLASRLPVYSVYVFECMCLRLSMYVCVY